MPVDLAASVAILQNDRIVLIKREDFAVWGLPSGQVEAGETVAQAAFREAREETGLEVQITHLVGLYSLPRWVGGGNHTVLFAAVPVAGRLQTHCEEVVDSGYFALHALPSPLIWWHRQRIADAFSGQCGVVRTQHVRWPFAPRLTRAQLYELRDRSGLSRQCFYERYFGTDPAEGDIA